MANPHLQGYHDLYKDSSFFQICNSDITFTFKFSKNIDFQQRISLMTPLHLACRYGEEEVIKWLIEIGANIFQKDADSNIPLHYCIKFMDNLNVVKMFFEKASKEKNAEKSKETLLFAKNCFGFTALRLAVEYNRNQTAEYLLQQYKKEDNIVNDFTLIHISARKNNFSMLTMLINYGWNVNAKNDKNETILHVAVKNSNSFLVQELLSKCSADIEAKDQRGYTPLLVAISCDNVDMVKMLLKNRALITRTPDPTWYKLMLPPEDALQLGGSISEESVLTIAARYNSTNVFLYFMQNDAHFSRAEVLYQFDSFLNTPFHYAAENENIEILKAIINFYKDIDLCNCYVQTPLHIAAYKENAEIFELFLNVSESSINLSDKWDETPVTIAFKKDSAKILKLLEKHIASLQDVESREYYLRKAIKTKNMNLLKYLFSRKNITYWEYISIDNQDSFKMAISNGFVEGVEYILNTDLWTTFMRRRSPAICIKDSSSMQLLIQYMPDMAKIVFDKCLFHHEQLKSCMYEFINDVYHDPAKRDFVIKKRIYEACPTAEIKEAKIKTDRKKQKLSYNQIIAYHPLTLILKYERYDLLFHELVESYIDTKWNRYAKIGYYFLCCFYLFFAIFSTWITLDTKSKLINQENLKATPDMNECLIDSHYGWATTALGSTLLLLAIYKNVLKFFHLRSFVFQMVVVVLTVLAGQPLCNSLNINHQWNLTIFLNLCSWFCLLNYIKKHPRFGVYVVMVRHIVQSFIRFVPVFVMFLLPFVILFYLLLGEKQGTFAFFETFVQTLVMMIGELDYKDSIAKKSSVIISLIFCLFLFTITILLMNLLIGIAVSDTSKILQKASLTRRIMQIETIHHVEAAMPHSLRKKYWKAFCKEKNYNEIYEAQKHWCTSEKFRQMFKWWGLPKSAIKDEIPNDESSEILKNLDIKYGDLRKRLDNVAVKFDNRTAEIIRRLPEKSDTAIEFIDT